MENKPTTIFNYSRIQCGLIFVVDCLCDELKDLIREWDEKAKLILISSAHGFYDEPDDFENGDFIEMNTLPMTDFPASLTDLRVIDQNHNCFEIEKVMVSYNYKKKIHASEDISISILKNSKETDRIIKGFYLDRCKHLQFPESKKPHLLQIHDILEGCSFLYKSKKKYDLYGSKGNVERIDEHSNIHLKTFSAHGDSGTCFFKDNVLVGVLHGGDESFKGLKEKQYLSLEDKFKENMKSIGNYIVKISSSQAKFTTKITDFQSFMKRNLKRKLEKKKSFVSHDYNRGNCSQS